MSPPVLALSVKLLVLVLELEITFQEGAIRQCSSQESACNLRLPDGGMNREWDKGSRAGSA